MYLEDLQSPTVELQQFSFSFKTLQNGWSYIWDSREFIYKMKRIEKVNEGYFLVTKNMVGL